jgi:L-aminopeptidase/D-esterase-like protein
MQGLKVGHATHHEWGTGLTVFLFDRPATGSYLLCGSGPASHELAPLEPDNSVEAVHALLFSGGSAFGLHAANGVMRYLTESGIGLRLPHGTVPIVPAVAIYDLAHKTPLPPTDVDAYRACVHATEGNEEQGQVGAGTGATVGKIVPHAMPMQGGLGVAKLQLASGLEVVVYAVVNPVGDVRDANNQIIAGAKTKDGQFADCEKYLFSGVGEKEFIQRANTTLVAVFTNAALTKTELRRVCKMAIAGMARAIAPVFSCYDGDILFAISLGVQAASVFTVGTIAAELVRQAIVNAVQDSQLLT